MIPNIPSLIGNAVRAKENALIRRECRNCNRAGGVRRRCGVCNAELCTKCDYGLPCPYCGGHT